MPLNIGDIVLPHLELHVGRRACCRSLPVERFFGLVVAAPDDDAGMIAQAPHLVFGFRRDVQLEGIGARLPVVAEHEVLPDHDAEFVAELVELVGLVIAAAPVADHVHVGVRGRLENAAVVGRR